MTAGIELFDSKSIGWLKRRVKSSRAIFDLLQRDRLREEFGSEDVG